MDEGWFDYKLIYVANFPIKTKKNTKLKTLLRTGNFPCIFNAYFHTHSQKKQLMYQDNFKYKKGLTRVGLWSHFTLT